MIYSAAYQDERGAEKRAVITDADSVAALKNDYLELMRTYDPRVVRIVRLKAAPGEALHLQVTVLAPSHYLNAPADRQPKPCSAMSVELCCYPGYPLTAIRASYRGTCRLASPNVFSFGAACIDTWKPFVSSLNTTVDKLVRDIIHDPAVSRYESPACPELIEWHRQGAAEKRFPTIAPKRLYAPEKPRR